VRARGWIGRRGRGEGTVSDTEDEKTRETVSEGERDREEVAAMGIVGIWSQKIGELGKMKNGKI
jgi:hypothetical protein